MSRQDLNNFVHSVEHSFSLRKKLRECNENKEKILRLAKEYGFIITSKDLLEDSNAEAIKKWFNSSRI